MIQRGLRFVALAAITVCVLALTSCSSLISPEVTLTGVDVTGISTDGLEMKLLLDVMNPNPVGATASALEYHILVDNIELAEGRQHEAVEIEAGATSAIEIPFTLKWSGMADQLKGLTDGRKHEWALRGNATLAHGPLSKMFTFSERGDFTTSADIDLDLFD
jgi:LEA14-like dessication related protein